MQPREIKNQINRRFTADLQTAQMFYPFGMTMPGRIYKSDDYNYGFGGHEKDDEVKGSGNHLSFGDYGYDTRLGKRWKIDPMASKMPAWTPYSFAFNNPIVYIDPEGLYPIFIVTRSYAPFKTFGPSFAQYEGDDRGHTLDRSASYRTLVSINYDTETMRPEAFGGRSTSKRADGSSSSESPTKIDDRSNGNNIDVHSFGNNADVQNSFDIDQFTKLKITTEGDIKQDHILNITGTISGDNFPSQESFVYDSEGNSLWLGNFATSGGPVKGVLWDLGRENEDDVNIKINIKIKVNSDGVFQGIMRGDKMISIDEWNNSHEETE